VSDKSEWRGWFLLWALKTSNTSALTRGSICFVIDRSLRIIKWRRLPRYRPTYLHTWLNVLLLGM
jgi:hypothetical protein